ncbi:hypothetical protein NQ315_011929 [Exocentrus adspersus]|uniref:TBC1 domain family member 7 n=1 Tax=Exocentrus adspersus TaxID=1586481 RepID=A0AAV8W195_9CUCU|nr:hypothetical protein NQ315_011929 [Exocentrus adspersus]
MAADEKNFRSVYYEKVGFRSVEEKKSLEILLKDKPLDRGKLKQFCLRFCLPATYRNLMWKLLLGVVPVHVECHAFVMDQRKQEFTDLLRALNVMRVIDSYTSKPQIFLAMWLLQTGNFTCDINLIDEKGFVSIVQAMMQFFEDETDVYWLAKNFYENVDKFQADIPKLTECSYNLLEKEDAELYKYLHRIGVLDNLPVGRWFDCCFAGVLNETALAKIWDKICGGSYKILAYVVVVLLTNLKIRILKCSSLTGVLQCIKNIPEETADIIANKSIEMWQHNGSPLTMHDKPKP